MRSAVQEREVGVAVKLDVRFHAGVATRRSQATNLGDCGPRESRATFAYGPEGNVRGIWHQPQGRRRSQRGGPSGSLLFLELASDQSVIDPFHEPPVLLEVVVQLAQKTAVQHSFPVLADHGLLPPLGFDLPARDRVDRTAEGAGD